MEQELALLVLGSGFCALGTWPLGLVLGDDPGFGSLGL